MFRLLVYVFGLIILSLGLILNTKTGLGASAVMSVPFAVSEIWDLDLGNVTFIIYVVFVGIEIFLICIYREKLKVNLKHKIILIILQLPVSIFFTGFVSIFSNALPVFESHHFSVRIAVLAVAVICTGVGAGLCLRARLCPVPADGIVQVFSDISGKNVGLCKNLFDLFNVMLTICISVTVTGSIFGLGIGTLAAVIGVGRVIALTNHIMTKYTNI